MNNENEPCDKITKDRLMDQGVIISDTVGPLTRKQALALIGEAMLNKFIHEFVPLWKELFADCQIKDFQATEEDWKRWLGSDYKVSIE